MKRPPQSFVVQHKRRPRAAKDEPSSIWTGDAARALRDLERAEAELLLDPADAPDLPTAGIVENASSAAAAPKRILEARQPPDLASDPELVAETAEPKRRGRPRKSAPPESGLQRHDGELHEQLQPDGIADIAEEAPAIVSVEAPSPSLLSERGERPSYRDRRRAGRRALPLGERWRWNLKY